MDRKIKTNLLYGLQKETLSDFSNNVQMCFRTEKPHRELKIG